MPLKIPYCTLCGGEPTRDGDRVVCNSCGAVLKESDPDGCLRGYE